MELSYRDGVVVVMSGIRRICLRRPRQEQDLRGCVNSPNAREVQTEEEHK